jgi:hypothetical protein
VIVYADRPREAATETLLARVRAALRRLGQGPAVEYESTVELLVAFGDLETALVDALEPECDTDAAASRALRRVSHAIGRLLHASWRADAAAARHWRERVTAGVAALDSRSWPALVSPRVPEGYVFYSVRPETYLEAARRFFAESRPRRVVCIGLRSIGVSLGAVVAATLSASGVAVRSFALRPRGHPFDRGLVLSAQLERELRGAAEDAFVAIVDEGPGLSGSSLTGVARAMGDMGVPDERIVLFPSWQADPDRFVSAEAARRWRRHRSHVGHFEDLWLHNSRLAGAFAATALTDLSAGRWRPLLFADDTAQPAAHPHHERRKYLARVEKSGEPRHQLVKFSGLGDYGRAALARARALADGGFGPQPRALRHGFLAMDFVSGRPLTPADVSPAFLEAAADYVALVSRLDAQPEPVAFERLLGMMRENVGEALGPGGVAALARLGTAAAVVAAGRAIAIDGRMLPHEWLLAGDRYVKTDGVDHHDDHLFPGRQDVAWDVAGTVVEFELDDGAAAAFASACSGRLGDPGMERRLPFYTVAYLAYRLGYCALAAASVDEHERRRFEALTGRYRERLGAALLGEHPAA